MAAGFKDYLYELENGTLARIRLSALDKAVAGNTAPTGVWSGLRVYNRRSGRKLGVMPRRLVLSRVVRAGDEANGIPDQTTKAYVTILSKAAFATYDQDATIAYGGKNWTIDGFQTEKNNG